jgi:GTP-binding protein
VPGTTRDAIDSVVTFRGSRYLMVDTAGIRRVRALKERVDHVSVVQARGAIERCDVAVVVVDAEAGPRELDATIAGHADEAGCGVVVAVNKWDRAQQLGLAQRGFEQELRRHLKFLAYAPVVPVSALTGLGLSRMLKSVDRVCASRLTRVSTGVLNRLVGKAAAAHAPRAAKGGSAISILYAVQVGTAPPTFSLALNRAGDLHFSYRRYLENRLRDAFGFEGTPIVLRTRLRRH